MHFWSFLGPITVLWSDQEDLTTWEPAPDTGKMEIEIDE